MIGYFKKMGSDITSDPSPITGTAEVLRDIDL